MAMISGTFAKIEESGQEVPDLDEVSLDGGEATGYVNLEDEFYISTDHQVKQGLAAKSYSEEVDDIEFENGDLSVVSREVDRTSWTRFWIFPDEYVAVQNQSGDFAFELLEEITDSSLSFVSFDLAEIVRDHPGQWMGGFEDRDDHVEKGTLYGHEIEYDGDLGDAFLDSDKNQIGPRVTYGGRELKLRIGDSWFQVTSPADFTRQEHLEFFQEFMINYV